jgi:hypothetical protein
MAARHFLEPPLQAEQDLLLDARRLLRLDADRVPRLRQVLDRARHLVQRSRNSEPQRERDQRPNNA